MAAIEQVFKGNQQVMDYPSFKLVIVGNCGTGPEAKPALASNTKKGTAKSKKTVGPKGEGLVVALDKEPSKKQARVVTKKSVGAK